MQGYKIKECILFYFISREAAIQEANTQELMAQKGILILNHHLYSTYY
jgi:hypothetical protein